MLSGTSSIQELRQDYASIPSYECTLNKLLYPHLALSAFGLLTADLEQPEEEPGDLLLLRSKAGA
jgi:hypothetical protein